MNGGRSKDGDGGDGDDGDSDGGGGGKIEGQRRAMAIIGC